MANEILNDWHSVQTLLSDWSYQACLNRIASAEKAKGYKRRHQLLGIPVVIFSSVVGSVAFSQIHAAPNDKVRFGAGALSIVSAVLAGLQTFLRYGELAEKYRAVGIGYEKVEKEIEEIIVLPIHLRGDVKERIDSLREQLNSLADGSPEIPDHRHQKAKTKIETK